jgi:hypothetical protein
MRRYEFHIRRGINAFPEWFLTVCHRKDLQYLVVQKSLIRCEKQRFQAAAARPKAIRSGISKESPAKHAKRALLDRDRPQFGISTIRKCPRV